LVVESAASGGSLITAQFAADQGRTVFAVPGRIDQPSSAGCHKIIREGATLVRSSADIIEDLRPYMLQDQILLNFEDGEKTNGSRDHITENLSETEKLLIRELNEGEQLSLVELEQRIGIGIADTMSALTLLELNRHVKKHPSGKFELI
jgi:DNA processing protein